MRICDVMSSPVVSVPPDALLKDVASLLVERRINAVPVVDAGGRLVGIVSEADLLPLETGPGQVPGAMAPHLAREVMRQSVYTLAEDTDATAAARMMLRHGLKSVPVVSGDQLVGIVARRDLLRLVARGGDDEGFRIVTADELKARRHAREIVGELRWRGMSVPALYVRMADEFQDLVRSGDYDTWVTASQKPAVMAPRSHVADAPGPMRPDRPAAHMTPQGPAPRHPARRPPSRAAAVA
jgi:CBS domain-containing protein